MSKNTLLTILLTIAGVALWAQSFTLTDVNNNSIPNGGVFQMSAPPGTALMEFHCFIKNNSNEIKKLKVKKTEIQLVQGSLNTICWTNICYPPAVYVSPDLLTLNPGQTSGLNDFYGDYIPGQNQGLSKIMYTFFDERNANDSVSVVVHFLVGNTGIDLNPSLFVNALSAPYPNPASQFVAFDVKLPAQVYSASLIVRNLVGTTVAEMPLATFNGRVFLNVTDLREGVYFYTLMVNGGSAVKTGKLIVKR